MNIPIDKQIAFLTWQIKEHETAHLNYLTKQLKQHFRDKSAFKGKIWGIDEKRASVIISFPRGLAPRLNYPLQGYLYNGVPFPDDLTKWDFNFQFFRQNYIKAKTELHSLFILKSNDPENILIGFQGIDAEFFRNIQQLLQKNIKPSILLGEKDPPIQYLLNLRDFIAANNADPILNIDIDKSLDDWTPENLLSEPSKLHSVINALENCAEVIIQGPPGTGKSHLVAQISHHYLQEGKSVCITALTNKALMEVAEKDGILSWTEKEAVYKTNLTAEEQKKLQKLKRAEKLSIGRGQLLLATYYKLSDWFKKENAEAQIIKPIYDLVIIEEASQSFLATIAAFKTLGRKVLIVGDPLQLPPIVLNENIAVNIHPWIMSFAKGLETYAANSGDKSFLLCESYRLSEAAVQKTGIFYKNKLTSVQPKRKEIKTLSRFQHFVPNDGGPKLAFMSLVAEGDRPKDAISLVSDFVIELRQKNPTLEIAVLAPFKNTVLALQERLGISLDDFSGITVETIDRIQGLTVDLTVYLLALNNPSFALNLNRFNVATSRSKSGTLIITDREYIRFMGTHTDVNKYLINTASFTI